MPLYFLNILWMAGRTLAGETVDTASQETGIELYRPEYALRQPPRMVKARNYLHQNDDDLTRNGIGPGFLRHAWADFQQTGISMEWLVDILHARALAPAAIAAQMPASMGLVSALNLSAIWAPNAPGFKRRSPS